MTGSSDPLSESAVASQGASSPEAELRVVRLFFIGLGIYFGLHILIRSFLSTSLDLDEAQQMMLAQGWRWGYGPQPPLYTWLQIVFFKVFGLGVFPLALFKNILLFATYLFTFLNARLVTGRPAAAVAASACLLFMHQFAWESQRDLTHSVLASTLATAGLFYFLEALTRRRRRDYVLFGVCAGLGMLAKYNYAVFLAGLILAALSLRQYRPAVLSLNTALALAVALLVFLPHGIWILQHSKMVLVSTSKFHAAESGNGLADILHGLKELVVAVLTFLGPMAAVLGLALWQRSASWSLQWRAGFEQLLLRLLAIVGCLIVLGVVVLHVTEIHDRWLQPILVCAPVAMIAVFYYNLNATALKRILIAASVVMVGVLVCIPGRVLLAGRMNRVERLNQPYDELARQIEKTIAPASVIIVDHPLLGGNLRRHLPGKTFVTPRVASLFLQPEQSRAYVWTPNQDKALLGELRQFAAESNFNLTNATPQFFTARYKRPTSKSLRIAVVVP